LLEILVVTTSLWFYNFVQVLSVIGYEVLSEVSATASVAFLLLSNLTFSGPLKLLDRPIACGLIEFSNMTTIGAGLEH